MKGLYTPVAALFLILLSFPSPVHAGREELLKACRGFHDDDSGRRSLNSCNRLIEQYAGDFNREGLGYLYARRGTAKNHFKQYASAISDYRRAVELGYSGGYFGLGMAYMGGKGVPEDERRAKELFEKGCDLEDIGSCMYLEFWE